MHIFPKILFIADEIPQSINAGSILIYRLLKDYPSDKLVVMGRLPKKGAEILDCAYYNLEFPMLDRIRSTRFHTLMNSIELSQLLPYQLPKHLKAIADDFKPDIILSVLQLYKYYQSAYHYSKTSNIPLALIIHDQPEEFQKVYTPFKKLQIYLNAKIYKHAFLKMNVSKEMEFFFRTHYGSKGDVLYPLPSNSIQQRNINDSIALKQKDVLTVGYAGTPAYGYSYQLKSMLKVFASSNVVLRFYGSNLPDELQDQENVTYAGYNTPENTWKNVQYECDAVILPYSWLLKHKKLYSTHFPSKLPEYLSLGMPVIIVGPNWATGVKWGIANNDSVLLLLEENKSEWKSILEKLRIEKNFRKMLSLKALEKKESDFNPEKIKAQFYHLINR